MYYFSFFNQSLLRASKTGSMFFKPLLCLRRCVMQIFAPENTSSLVKVFSHNCPICFHIHLSLYPDSCPSSCCRTNILTDDISESVWLLCLRYFHMLQFFQICFLTQSLNLLALFFTLTRIDNSEIFYRQLCAFLTVPSKFKQGTGELQPSL